LQLEKLYDGDIWEGVSYVFGGWEFNAGIYFLEFRPSEIAAAVAIAVVGETKTVDAEQAISVLAQPVQKVKLVPCGPKQ